jgi:hypothetical protein
MEIKCVSMNDQQVSDSEFHHRYLQSRLDKLSVASHLNAQQIVVYKKILNLAKSAKSYEHYLELLGDSADFFPVAQAEQMDRFRSLEEFYNSIPLKEYVESHHKKHKIAEDCKSYADIATKLPQGYGAGFQIEEGAKERLNSAMSLLTYMIHFSCLADAKEKRDMFSVIRSEFAKIQKYDPDFTFASLEKRPYNLVHPFDSVKLKQLQKIYEENL